MRQLAYKPKHSGDEVFLGIVVTLAVHLVPVLIVALHVVFPPPPEPEEEAIVAKPVIAANLLKLGKIDPNRLPDRLRPVMNTAPKKDVVASANDPSKKLPDGGAPALAQDSDRVNKADKNDLFAEDGGRRPMEGNAAGVDGGTETDPTKAHAGDMYAAKLGQFIRERWSIPSVISQGEASRLCVVYQVNIGPRMVIWYLRSDPIKKSGNDLFDDSARGVLQKLLDDKTALPDPPPEVENQYRNHTVQLLLSGDMHGDASQCK
jgi:hypothetical protein